MPVNGLNVFDKAFPGLLEDPFEDQRFAQFYANGRAVFALKFFVANAVKEVGADTGRDVILSVHCFDGVENGHGPKKVWPPIGSV